jgi:hypothetical protein
MEILTIIGIKNASNVFIEFKYVKLYRVETTLLIYIFYVELFLNNCLFIQELPLKMVDIYGR